jgi:uncharacterized protein (TIGR02996 family)
MHTPWEVYLQGFLDGYAFAAALTGEAPRGPKKIGSKGAVTQFVKGASERCEAAITGALAPAFEALLGELFTLHGEGLRKATAAAFVTGAKLRCYECDAKPSLLDELFDGPKKVKGAAIPKGKAPANEDLLGAVLSKPDDDAPRLVFADYLSTSGDPRGEFIQLQCTLGNIAGYTPREPTRTVENAEALVKRCETLLKHSRGQWLDGLKLATVSWSRGFPMKGTAEALDFITNERFDRVPLEAISLIHWNGKIAEAAFKRKKHPTLRRFWFGSGFGPKILHLVGAPVFADATELDAGFWDEAPIPPRAIEVLGASVFSKLERLTGPAEVFAAFAHASCPRLKTFEVTEGWRMAPVRGTKLWRQLTRLEVFRLDAESDFEALQDASSLEVFSMVTGELGEANVKQLIAMAPKSLKTLEGGFGELSPQLVKALEKRFALKPL